MIWAGVRDMDLLETTGAVTKPPRRKVDHLARARTRQGRNAAIAIGIVASGWVISELLMRVLLNESLLLALGVRP